MNKVKRFIGLTLLVSIIWGILFYFINRSNCFDLTFLMTMGFMIGIIMWEYCNKMEEKNKKR